ncbi:MAG: ABC transporter permease subunit [Nocardioidaceae bacterium]
MLTALTAGGRDRKTDPVVEVLFGWPGMGRLLVDGLQDRDSPIILGVFLLVSLTVVAANLVTDLAYVWLDPRVSYR